MAARSPAPPTQMHGKLSEITHNGRGVFRGINGTFNATRIIRCRSRRKRCRRRWRVTATADDGVVMGAMHKTIRCTACKSIRMGRSPSEHGHLILRNFLDIAADWNRKHRAVRKVA